MNEYNPILSKERNAAMRIEQGTHPDPSIEQIANWIRFALCDYGQEFSDPRGEETLDRVLGLDPS